jgi:hypothetical protein
VYPFSVHRHICQSSLRGTWAKFGLRAGLKKARGSVIARPGLTVGPVIARTRPERSKNPARPEKPSPTRLKCTKMQAQVRPGPTFGLSFQA